MQANAEWDIGALAGEDAEFIKNHSTKCSIYSIPSGYIGVRDERGCLIAACEVFVGDSATVRSLAVGTADDKERIKLLITNKIKKIWPNTSIRWEGQDSSNNAGRQIGTKRDTVEFGIEDLSKLSETMVRRGIPTKYKLRDGNLVVLYHPTKEADSSKGSLIDTQQLRAQGIRVVNIYEFELYDDRRRRAIEELLLSMINPNKAKIGARDTQIVSDMPSTCYGFLNQHHIMGALVASGTVYKCVSNSGELLGVLQVGVPRFGTTECLEVTRMCWRPDVAVIGGTAKLFQHMIKDTGATEVVCYSDVAKFTGDTYEKLGMARDRQITRPNYHWVKGRDALSRYQTQKHKLLAQGFGDESMTEREIMQARGYTQVFDCGNYRFLWRA